MMKFAFYLLVLAAFFAYINTHTFTKRIQKLFTAFCMWACLLGSIALAVLTYLEVLE